MVPNRSASVIPRSTAKASIWWNTGEWRASRVSLRYVRPGATTKIGGDWVSMVRICTGDVCVRSMTCSGSPSST